MEEEKEFCHRLAGPPLTAIHGSTGHGMHLAWHKILNAGSVVAYNRASAAAAATQRIEQTTIAEMFTRTSASSALPHPTAPQPHNATSAHGNTENTCNHTHTRASNIVPRNRTPPGPRSLLTAPGG